MKTITASFTTEAELQHALDLLHQHRFDQPAPQKQTKTLRQSHPFAVEQVSTPARGRWWNRALPLWTLIGTIGGAVGGLLVGDNAFGYLTDGSRTTIIAATSIGISVGLLLGFSLGTLIMFFAPTLKISISS